MHDVIIVGGGPGGLYAARHLSRNGFDVVVIEEHPMFGMPVHCTGILGAESYDEYELPRKAILNELQSVRFYSPSGQTFSYTHDRIEAVVIDRAIFDEALSVEAKASGAAMISGNRVTRIDTGSDGVKASMGNGEEIHARACVLACGANYTLQRMLCLGAPSLFLASAQAELPARYCAEVEMHFSSQVAPKGFAWAVPVRRGNENSTQARILRPYFPRHASAAAASCNE